MPAPAKTAHPLRSRTGASQRKRVLDALKPGMAAIDGRSLADILYFISRYAGQVNFHEYRLDEQEGEYIALSDWRDFFKNSPPFLLARLSKKDLGAIETQYLALAQALDEQPLAENLDQLFAFLESDLLQPVSDLYQAVQTAGISFESELANSIKSTLREPLLQFIALSNGAAQHLCTRKQNFSAYSAYPWQLSIQDLYALNACFKTLKGGKPAAIAEINQLLKPIFYQLLTGLGQISAKAPDHIQEALFPEEAALQKLHPPHLGLLFAFLELFKYLQGDLNALGQKHLDYFFSKALNIRAKAAVPDRAHLVFELANHLEQYALKKNTRIKDGKDGNNQDILFGLDQEIVLDKAAVAELRSLYVNTESVVADGQKLSFVEGVYAAPVANSADGKGKPFPAEGSKNWPTLGAKDSKCILPGQDEPEEHPPARIGFVLASPALLLQEGTREVIFNITCEPPIDKAGLACLKKYADPFSSDFQWGKFYWLTETAVQKLAASTEPVFSIETLQALNLLLARQNPYPVGYQIENLKALLYEEGCAVDQTKRTEEIKAYTTLLEADAEKTHACFIRKSDVDALPKSDLKLRLQNLFTDDQPDETVRYVDTRRLAQADLDFLTDAAN
ncbi:MAG: hypothetical protein JNK89_09165, partial [Saprospiraceae bacterium]|nr:hypothetical protein [Saprospiraceae bacterium]